MLTTMKPIRRFKPLALLFGGLCLAGCQVQFIAPYDETLDTSMTKVQNDTESFFVKLQDAGKTDAGSYNATKSYYLTTEATLRTLLTRAQSTPKSDKIADQIDQLEKNVELIQGMHERDAYLNSANLAGDRESMENGFRSFFSLELGLKSASASNKTTPAAKTAKK
jgi:hypothetical protein